MDKRFTEQESLSRRRAALKNIYSSLLILAYHGQDGEFAPLIRASSRFFELYKIKEPVLQSSDNVYCLESYRNSRREN
jgi:hypothetical protein